MSSGLVQEERKRLARIRRGMPLLWVFVGLLAVGTILKCVRLAQIAAAHGVDVNRAWATVSMRAPERLTRSFAGYEVVMVDYAISALVYGSAFVLAVVTLTLRTGALRRQLTLLDYTEELERRVMSADDGTVPGDP